MTPAAAQIIDLIAQEMAAELLRAPSDRVEIPKKAANGERRGQGDKSETSRGARLSELGIPYDRAPPCNP